MHAFVRVFLKMRSLLYTFFSGFAESRPWECRVFSFEIARISQKSRAFPFAFVPAPRKSHDLHLNLFIFV